METKSEALEKQSVEYNIENLTLENKAYFGAFLNIATNNLDQILEYIKPQLENCPIKSGIGIEWLKKIKKYPIEKQAQALRLLLQHLPFLYVIYDEETPFLRNHPKRLSDKHTLRDKNGISTIIEILILLGKRLKTERDQYSHFKAQSADQNEIKKVKEIIEKLDDNFYKALGNNPNKHENASDQRQRAKRLYSFLDETSYKELIEKKFSVSFWDKKDEYAFSTHGLVFFTALFLTKREACWFISKITGLKNASTDYTRLSRAKYYHHCCALPRPRWEGFDPALSILTELQKAPKLLRNLLSEEDQQKYNLISEAHSNMMLLDETKVKLFRNATHDRFPYLTLRYFEEIKAFKHLKFQLYLGRLITDKYPKKIQKESISRLILKDIFVFGNLNEIHKQKLQEDNKWNIHENHDPKDEEAGDVIQYSPHYHFETKHQSRIGFKFSKESLIPKIIKKDKPKKERTLYKLSYNIKPDAYLSVHELPDLFLYHHLCPEYTEEERKILCKRGVDKYKYNPVELLIHQYIENITRFFKDLNAEKIKPMQNNICGKRDNNKCGISRQRTSPYLEENFNEIMKRRKTLQEKLDANYKGLKIHHLPNDVQKYLLGFKRVSYHSRVISKLNEIRADNKIREKQIERFNPENPNLKQGEMASFLASDFVYLKPYTNPSQQNPKQGKPNNAEYRRLQQILALYGAYENQLMPFLNELGLIKGEAPHPFLHKLRNKHGKIPRTLFDFYKKYIHERCNYFGYHKGQDAKEGILEEIQGKYNRSKQRFEGGLAGNEICNKYGHLFHFNYKSETVPKKTYGEHPIMLPRGLFRDHILAHKDIDIAKDTSQEQRNNTVYALQKYLNHDTQAFYQADRHYKLSKNSGIENREALERQVKTKASRLQFVQEVSREKEISREKEALRAEKSSDKKKTLKKRPKTEREKFQNHILKTEKKIRIIQHQDRCLWLMAKRLTKQKTASLEGFNIKKESLHDLNAFLSKKFEISTTTNDNVSISESLNIRQYGELQRLKYDKRVINLFKYFPNTTFTKTQLDHAINFYEDNAHLIFRKSLMLEQKIHEKWEHGSNSDFVEYYKNRNLGKSYVSHNIYIEFLCQKHIIETNQVKNHILLKIRNSINHSDIIYDEELKNKLNDHISTLEKKDVYSLKKFVEKMFEKIEAMYDNYYKKIELC